MNNVACWYSLSDKLWLCKHAIYLCQHQHAIIIMQIKLHVNIEFSHVDVIMLHVDINFHAELCQHNLDKLILDLSKNDK